VRYEPSTSQGCRDDSLEREDQHVSGQGIKRTHLYGPERESAGDGLPRTFTNQKVTRNSVVETNRACLSAVTSSRFAYNSPNAARLVVRWNTGRVKWTTRDLVQAFVGAKRSCAIRCIKARNARGARAQTRSWGVSIISSG